MTPERLIIVPIATRPGAFTARLERTNNVIVERTRQPVVDAARRLIAMGFDPEIPLTMRHVGKTYDSFEPQPIGECARWTYEEGEKTKLHARRWKPFPGGRYRQKSGSDEAAGRGAAVSPRSTVASERPEPGGQR